VARVTRRRRAIQLVHAYQELASGRHLPGRTHERAGNRPAGPVGVAVFPHQAGLLDVGAGDVETEDRAGQIAAVAVDARQLVTPHALAAADAVGIGEDDLDIRDIGIRGEEFLRLARGAFGGHGVTGSFVRLRLG
jgi:hypothetical protein